MTISIFTIGHSNRTLEQLLEALAANAIELLIDVRKFPYSRRNPQFNAGFLGTQLEGIAINYSHQGEVFGGHREPAPLDRRNHPQLGGVFRAYATHMNTKVFKDAMTQLVTSAQSQRLCLMCAEHSPGNCHRNLMADFLSLHDVNVVHIIDSATSLPHIRHEAVRWRDGEVRYDSGAQLSLSL